MAHDINGLRLSLGPNTGMQSGDLFDKRGYDVDISMSVGERYVYVLNNNSSHYLVAVSHDTRFEELVELICTFGFISGPMTTFNSTDIGSLPAMLARRCAVAVAAVLAQG